MLCRIFGSANTAQRKPLMKKSRIPPHASSADSGQRQVNQSHTTAITPWCAQISFSNFNADLAPCSALRPQGFEKDPTNVPGDVTYSWLFRSSTGLIWRLTHHPNRIHGEIEGYQLLYQLLSSRLREARFISFTRSQLEGNSRPQFQTLCFEDCGQLNYATTTLCASVTKKLQILGSVSIL